MHYYLDLTTSDGVGNTISATTASVEGENQEVLDDVLASMKSAQPVFDNITSYIGAQAESGKWTPEEHLAITQHVEDMAANAQLDPAAQVQLDHFVAQCMTNNLVDPFNTQYIGYIYDVTMEHISDVSTAINAGQHDFEVKDVQVEIVTE